MGASLQNCWAVMKLFFKKIIYCLLKLSICYVSPEKECESFYYHQVNAQ